MHTVLIMMSESSMINSAHLAVGEPFSRGRAAQRRPTAAAHAEKESHIMPRTRKTTTPSNHAHNIPIVPEIITIMR